MPVASLAPDSCVALAYGEVVELLAGTVGTMSAIRRRGLRVDDPLGAGDERGGAAAASRRAR